jgi:hypothetical protein
MNFQKSSSPAPPEAKIFDKMAATHLLDQFSGETGRGHRKCRPFAEGIDRTSALAIGQPLINRGEGLKGEAAVPAEA